MSPEWRASQVSPAQGTGVDADARAVRVTVVVGMPGHAAMPAPTQAEIDAAVAQQAARQAGRRLGTASQHRVAPPPGAPGPI